MEHRRVAGVEGLVAIRATGSDHVDRRIVGLHRADLHRRGVRAQHHLLGLTQPDVESVLHRAGGVRRRDVERLEVVPVVLDLGSLGDAVPEPDEDVLELPLHLRDEVEVAPAGAVAAGGEVDPLARGGRRRAPPRPRPPRGAPR